MVNKYSNPDAGKRARQEAVLETVLSESVATQTDLVRALKRKGIAATQASVSRDIAELGLIKAQGVYRAAPSPAADPEMPLRAYVQSAAAAGDNMLVLKCATGTAQQVGLALDRAPHTGVVGTIAGDDTVFVATASKAASRALVAHLKMLASAEGAS